MSGALGILTLCTILGNAPVDSSTWVDHDAQPIDRPRERSENFYSHCVRTAVVDPIGHFFDVPDKLLWIAGRFGLYSKQRAENVNAFDEVANSSWFTNRNHVHALPLEAVRAGAFGDIRPTAPFVVTGRKEGGTTVGFRVKDAHGKTWQFKLDPYGYPQLASGADVVVDRLLYAAGYNVSHDDAVSFRREDLTISDKLMAGSKGDAPFTNSELDATLAQGARGANGRYYAEASLFLPGESVGNIDTRGRREDDPNDRFRHSGRRELRGLFVLDSWLGSWDEYDLQSLDMFQGSEGKRGYVQHNLLDFGSSLGAASVGAKPPSYGYEYAVDYGWIGLRMITLGFVVEPWRRAHQKTDILSAGSFATQYDPPAFRTYLPYQPFRERTLDDDYWGAKLVASFSDAQIAAAIQAAGYEDARASAFLQKALTERRDQVVRYYFARVAPVDFFTVADGALAFRDLAVDLRLANARAYDVRVEPLAGRAARSEMRLAEPRLALTELGPEAQAVKLTISIHGEDARPAVVELVRRGDTWAVTRVRHAAS